MNHVSLDDRRTKGDEILDDVIGGATFEVTRYGQVIAELRP
jgi:antitoxin (DNA-binding transcriptional repressor) of toxin-antitoxin stability system